MIDLQTLNTTRERQINDNVIDVCLGIDVGAVAVKIAFCTIKDSLILHDYFRAHQNGDFYLLIQNNYNFILAKNQPTKGEPLAAVSSLLNHFHGVYPRLNIIAMCATGVGGKILKSIYDIPLENDLKSVAYGVAALVPTVQTILELGGESARYMRVELKKNGQELPQTVRILDYEKNGDCAAGTGAFIEQQAIRLGTQ